MQNGTVNFDINDGSGSLKKYTSKALLNTNIWNNIMIVKSNKKTSLFINGILDSKGSIDFGYNSNSNVSLGFNPLIAKSGFVGYLDEFLSFKKPLNEAEVQGLYLWYKNK